MAAVAAVYGFGAPAPKGVTERLLAAMSHRGSPRTVRQLGTVALAYAGRSVDRTHSDSSTYVVFDGHIDNRDELTRALRLDRSLTESTLIATAYTAWGLDFAARLIGDFAIILWDGALQRLVCARDIVGIKPLFYAPAADALRCASEIAAFERPSPELVNEELAGEYLACAISTPVETLHRGVLRVPPGHLLVADERGYRLQRFWSAGTVRDVRYESDGEYAEHLRHLLAEAVACRLDGATRPGLLLSGGLDSSTIAAFASALHQRGASPGPTTAVSAVFPGRSCDESSYVDAVVQATGLPSLTVEPRAIDRAAVDADARTFADFPGYPNIATTDAARAAASSHGIDVLLTGEGGDEWLAGSYYRYADFVRGLRILELGRAWHADREVAGSDGIEFPPMRVLRLGVWPCVPPAIKTVYRRLRGRGRRTVPDWIAPAFAKRINLADRIHVEFEREPGETFARAHTRSALGRAVDVHYLELMERSAARFGLDERHPFHDRRIIEFALGIPDEQRWRTQPKQVLRCAIDGIVPDVVRTRTTKAYFPHAYAEALLAGGGERIADTLHPWLAERVEIARIRVMLGHVADRYGAGDERYTEHIWPCWMVYGLNSWLRTVVDPAARVEEPAYA